MSGSPSCSRHVLTSKPLILNPKPLLFVAGSFHAVSRSAPELGLGLWLGGSCCAGRLCRVCAQLLHAKSLARQATGHEKPCVPASDTVL